MSPTPFILAGDMNLVGPRPYPVSEVNKFEEELSSFFGRRAIATVNGTAALHLALQCANINSNHSVLVPSLT